MTAMVKEIPRNVAAAAARRRLSAGPRTLGGGAWIVVATLAGLVLVNAPVLGSDPWPFDPGSIEPHGSLSFVVDAVGSEWDPEALRAGALVAGLVVVLVAIGSWFLRTWTRIAVAALVVVALLLLPAVLLQVALRESTAPWFYVNDSTYQIEIGGELVRDGENPYGYDYRSSGLERFYSFDGSVAYDFERPASEGPPVVRPSFHHFVYFPGPALSAAGWTALPRPWDDYRLLVALATLASFFAALAFRAPLPWRLAVGAVAAGNPLAVRAAWFGTADATSVVFLLLAFAFVSRTRYAAAGAALGAAILFKQFALLAVPFFVVMVVGRVGLRGAARATAALAAVVIAGCLPFLAWDFGAFLADAIPASDETYRIAGPGLASLLVELGVIGDRAGPYPFLALLTLVWLPLTAWLVWSQLRRRAVWFGAAGFAASVFVFIFLLRVLQPSYLVWPLAGLLAAVLLAAPDRGRLEPGPRTP